MAACCVLQLAGVSFRKIKVWFFEKELNLYSSRTRSTHLHTPQHCHAPTRQSALQSDDIYRLYAARKLQRTSVWCGVHVAGFNFGRDEVQFFPKTKLQFSQNSPCSSAKTTVPLFYITFFDFLFSPLGAVLQGFIHGASALLSAKFSLMLIARIQMIVLQQK